MPNAIKYSSVKQNNTILVNDFLLGINDAGYGESEDTGFYSGYDPPSGGYVIYVYGPAGIQIMAPQNDSELIELASRQKGSTVSTAADALDYFFTQEDKIVVNRTYENIVTDGLVLCLDAGFTGSYPRKGTVWRDISGNGNNGTLTNGPAFNSGNGGSIVFDGVNDLISISNNNQFRFTNTQPFSINTWVKCINTSGAVSILSYALSGGRGYYFAIDINILRTNSFFFDYWDGSSYRGIQGVSNSITVNSWIHLVATSSSNSVNDMKVYQNGILTSFTNRGTGTPNTIDYNTLSLQIGARGSSSYFKGNISQTLIYNRALTAQEILQNYNATKGRYGL